MSVCRCEDVRHRGAVCFKKPRKARSDYVGAVCDHCADWHVSEYLTVDPEGRITDYGRRILLAVGEVAQ